VLWADIFPACDESITAKAESERVMHEMQAANKQVSAVIVDPAFVISMRKKRWLGQLESC
jgi:HTH-type transcriptional regulator/antitoxin MqsA